MRCRYYILIFLLSLLLSAYRYRTAEQYYRIYHQHLYSYPEDIMLNINYLLAARSAPFNNALYALTPIADEQQWLYYQKLFRFHVNLELVRQHLLLGSKFDKYYAYFFNRPWGEEILDTLPTAESAYRLAAQFWQKALEFMPDLQYPDYLLPDLTRVRSWQDEVWQIREQRLDYQQIIDRQLQRIAKVREFFAQPGSTRQPVAD